MKICTKCKEEKPYESFSIHKKNKDGLRYTCKVCSSQLAKDRYTKRDTHIKLHTKEWKQLNPALVLAQKAKRRATKLNATPSWLTEEHHKQIADMYWLAKDLEAVSGQPYHVDHIIPLQGKGVCGLHVPWNLQVLPADINIGKSNKHVA